MKRKFLLISFSFVLVSLHAGDLFKGGHRKGVSSSGYFGLGPSGDVNTTWLLNPAISSRNQAYGFSMGGNFGLAFANYFTDQVALVLDVHYSMLNQNYVQGKHDSAYNSKNALTMINLPLTFLYVGESGSYIEAGVQLGILSGASYSRTGANANLYTTPLTPLSADETSNFAKMAFSGVVGFGMEGNIGDNFAYDIGFRINYGLNDLKGVDALGLVYNGTATTPVCGGIHLALKYQFRY